MVQFTKDLIGHLRRVAVLKFNPQMEELFRKEMMEEHLEILTEHAKIFADKDLELIKNLIKAYGEMRYSQFPIISLEVAIIESLKIPSRR